MDADNSTDPVLGSAGTVGERNQERTVTLVRMPKWQVEFERYLAYLKANWPELYELGGAEMADGIRPLFQKAYPTTLEEGESVDGNA